MPFYSRRKFQEMIDENRSFISEKVIQEVIGKLNSGKIKYLSVYWEIFILNVLSKIGKVEHEKNHGGSTNPDITFTNEKIKFLADIRVVSDSGQEKNNDYNYFISEFSSFTKGRGLDSLKGFDIRVSGELIGGKKERKAKIHLPPKNITRLFMQEHLRDFIDSIVRDSKSSRSINIDSMDAKLAINYESSKQYITGGYLDYTTIYSLEKNPIYNALNNKYDQLKRSGYSGKKGIFICDGDCKTLKERYTHGINSFSIEDIVKHFLSKKNIDFIVIIYIGQAHDVFHNTNNYFFKSRVFHEKEESTYLCSELNLQLNKILNIFPAPINTARNAVSLLKNNSFFPALSNFGGYVMNDEELTLSLRTILDLMVGNIDQEDFMNEYKHVINMLSYKIKMGYLPSNIEIVKEKYQDDDWISIQFNGVTDPSISKFK
ncbi:hypothetical protein KP24_06140 [Pectobacterium atrosepticum]|uniref:hypothetical protein n=2 Tax=Pectobacterium atrosepticum TaxID=29471 RepID=UPI000502A564|nr:hypothetical protein KP24_06140 [Pectobacterium atrosepticum]